MPSQPKPKARNRPAETRSVAPFYRYVRDLKRLIDQAKALVAGQEEGLDPWVDHADVLNLRAVLSDAEYRLTLAVLSIPSERCDRPHPPAIRTYREDGLTLNVVPTSGRSLVPDASPFVLAERCEVTAEADPRSE